LLSSLAMYYRGAAAAIVVFDITDSESFSVLQGWVEELKSRGPENITIAVAGNKADLVDKRVILFFPMEFS
jgi:GTPase SAR1 family protein